jgi:hypothetical protein
LFAWCDGSRIAHRPKDYESPAEKSRRTVITRGVIVDSLQGTRRFPNSSVYRHLPEVAFNGDRRISRAPTKR